MIVGLLEFDVLLRPLQNAHGGATGAVGSLKHKRAILRPVLARLRRFEVSVTEGGDPDRHRRALIGVALVSADRSHLLDVLQRCERQVAGEPELELLAVRRREFSADD